MKLVSLIIPIYNEELHLEKFLNKIDSLELACEKELVIVDDCSSDNSRCVVDAFDFKSRFIFVKQEVNRGKGAALKLGIEKATGDIIGIQDADFEYDIYDIPRIIKPILENRADVVFGSRFKKSNIQVHRTFHYLVNRFLTILSNMMSGLYLTDMETCYKFFRSDVIKNIILESNRFGFEPEVTAKLARLNLRIVEVPISYFPRSYLEGKKITWKDGIAALLHILYFNLAKKKARFRDSIPQKYIPSGRQWL